MSDQTLTEKDESVVDPLNSTIGGEIRYHVDRPILSQQNLTFCDTIFSYALSSFRRLIALLKLSGSMSFPSKVETDLDYAFAHCYQKSQTTG